MTSTPTVLAVVGRGLLPPGDPLVTAVDLGLTRGDGCFDATRVRTGPDGISHADEVPAHLDRLAESARRLAIRNPSRHAWTELTGEAVAAWAVPGEATLKWVLTRGPETPGGSPDAPTAFLTLTPMPAALIASRGGMTVATLGRGYASDAFAQAPWLLGGVKSLSYAVNMAATRQAREWGADEALFVSSDGFALEAPTSGLVFHRDGTLLSTPAGATGILASITQQRIFAGAARRGWAAGYQLARVADLLAADGVWLVSSGRGVAPVLAIDGRPVPSDPTLTGRVAELAGFTPLAPG